MYETATNRLMKYATFDTTGGGETLLSTTYYFYNDVGNPTRVVTETEAPVPGQPKYSATLMNYAPNGQAVTHMMRDTWNNDGSGIEDYAQGNRREFRYDGGRQRYMEAGLDEFPNVVDTSTEWMDYDGDQPYYAFNISHTNQLSRLEAWEPGLARVAGSSPFATASYFHTDHLGTTRHMSRGDGSVSEPGAYSAFGERVSGVEFHFYGYAGAFGYQTHEDFPFLHVGARYYDPATGRFLQRDPIGIGGGPNVYQYVSNQPTLAVDPSGLRLDSPNGEPQLPDIDGHGFPRRPWNPKRDPWGHFRGESCYTPPMSEEETLRRFFGENWRIGGKKKR
jgi:RHS repeat-associated protein